MKMKISRKKTKESRLWFDLTEPAPENEQDKIELMREATELIYIFSSILKNRKQF